MGGGGGGGGGFQSYSIIHAVTVLSCGMHCLSLVKPAWRPG